MLSYPSLTENVEPELEHFEEISPLRLFCPKESRRLKMRGTSVMSGDFVAKEVDWLQVALCAWAAAWLGFLGLFSFVLDYQ